MNEQLISLNNRLESLAITDDLTGLYNRREAMRRLDEQWTTTDRHQRPLAVVILDFDHFKRINDEYGHLAGDLVLRKPRRRSGNACAAPMPYAASGGTNS